MISRNYAIDKALKADAAPIHALREKMEIFQASVSRVPSTPDLMSITAIGFIATGASTWIGTGLSSFLKENAPSLEKFSLTVICNLAIKII